MNALECYIVMKRICHIIIITLFFALNAAAQNNKHGDVVVHTDPRLSVLLNKKRIVMQASAAKPVTHKSEDISMAAGASHYSAEVAPIAGVVTRPNAESTHSTSEATHPAARVPVYIREKEGRVIYSGKGFRVQIYSGNDREKAIMVKTEFMRHFPGIRTYLTYVSPCFRVKVGNYRNRSDATAMFKEVKSMYNPSVIVPDMITINSF